MLEKWLPIYALDESLRMHDFEVAVEEDDSLDGLGEPPHKRSKKSVSD